VVLSLASFFASAPSSRIKASVFWRTSAKPEPQGRATFVNQTRQKIQADVFFFNLCQPRQKSE
jgi:hypothetical protein